MSIPEPEFRITACQLNNILKDLKIDTSHISKDERGMWQELTKICFEHLDTI